MQLFSTQNVPFSRIRHSDLPCYRAEGFGGAPIERWPVYSFFQKCLAGEENAARQAFVMWYEDQLDKYHAASKWKGGMHKGSLYRLIEERCGVPYAQVGAQCKREAIQKRVQQRLDLLKVFQADGYQYEKSERIEAVRKGQLVYLRGGHHRAAALRALGASELPDVLVYPNVFVYNLITFLRRLKYAIVQG